MSAGRTLLRFLIPGAIYFVAVTAFVMLYAAVRPSSPDAIQALANAFGLVQVLVLLAGFALPLGVIFDIVDSTLHVSGWLPLMSGAFDPGGDVLRGINATYVARQTDRMPVDVERHWDPEVFFVARWHRRWARVILAVLSLRLEPGRRHHRDAVEHNRQTADLLTVSSLRHDQLEAERCREYYDRARMLGASRMAFSSAFATFFAIVFHDATANGDPNAIDQRAATAALATFGVAAAVLAAVVLTARDRGRLAAAPGSAALATAADHICWAIVLGTGSVVGMLAASGVFLLTGLGALHGAALVIGAAALPLGLYLVLYRVLNSARRQLQERCLAMQRAVIVRRFSLSGRSVQEMRLPSMLVSDRPSFRRLRHRGSFATRRSPLSGRAEHPEPSTDRSH